MYIKGGINWKRRTDLEREDTENIAIEIILKNSRNMHVTVF